jgi:prepilin-type N-terminal cleavage/methylation domain-containing protein
MKLMEDGFTIVELMIATAVFAIILIITTTTIIGISNTYIKGTVEDQTQQTARAVLSDISQDIEFNNNAFISQNPIPSTTTGDVYFFCIGDDVYVYDLDKVLSNTGTGAEYSPWDLVRYQSLTCPSQGDVPTTLSGFPAGYEELLLPNERLGHLDVVADTGDSNTYTVSLEIAFGTDNTLLSDTSPFLNGERTPPVSYVYPYLCQSGSDSSFCSVATLTTTVAPRVQ